MKNSSVLNSRGVTLIELVVAMVVMAIAMTGVMLVINYATSHSADPVLRHQAIAIAESYMEEICLKDISDPDGTDGESERVDYDDVDDYDGLSDSGVKDAYGDTVSGLDSYAVGVSVTDVSFGPTGNQVSGAQIVVTVTDPAGQSLSLTSYRADY
jgi:MSHA pilin protein MshD